jgi:dolichyl-phosphate beta-glucosyltransferase
MPRPVVVVPCYNEALRLDRAELLRLSEHTDVWLVDDGSKDDTRAVADGIASASNGRVRSLANERNLGKAETVRRAMLRAAEGSGVVGFLDADLATPVDEMLEILSELDRTGAIAVIGARVALSGRDIERQARRHYFGRVFSTIASLSMGAVIYDTQCGAKAFRVGPALRSALSEPFRSRWAFDVELLGRMLIGTRDVDPVPPDGIVEHPLRQWHDVAGSKLTARDMWKTGAELLLIARDLQARRRRAQRSSEPS